MTRPTREEMEEQLVELLQTSSAAEAKRLAARLLERGILAVANAERPEGTRSKRGMHYGFRTFVLVHEHDLEAANAMLDEMLGAEGDVPDHIIEQEMAAAEEDPDAAGAWFYEDTEAKVKARLATVMTRVFAIFVGAILTWMLINRFF